jgi:hypothetical protein
MTYSGWIKVKRQGWREVCRHATSDGCWSPPPPGLFDEVKP